MIFVHGVDTLIKGILIPDVHDGTTKFCTSRPVHEGDELVNGIVYRANGTKRYYVGQIHCVQTGRGISALWWSDYIPENNDKRIEIRITEIKEVDVRQFETPTIYDEGYTVYWGFMFVWMGMYDKKAVLRKDKFVDNDGEMNWQEYGDWIDMRSSKYYTAWLLRFEGVK